MAYRVLIFGTDDRYPKLKPLYDKAVAEGTLEIVATAELEGDAVNLIYADGKKGGIEDIPNFDLAIISSKNDFYNRMKQLEGMGFSRNRIIDGRVFQVHNLDFPRFLKEGVAHGIFENAEGFSDISSTIYPLSYTFKNNQSIVTLGMKSYISWRNKIERNGKLILGNFTALAWENRFEFGLNYLHDYKKLSSLDLSWFDWSFPSEFRPPQGIFQINIGSDVWIGRGCILKSANPAKPLVIGDGAVIASNSVVVKNVPPYAIVGGNPAKVIKYRFPPHVIKALLRIKWWDWSLDKIHDNFKYFNDIEKFISLHDPLKDDNEPEDENFIAYDIENTFDLNTDKIRNNFR